MRLDPARVACGWRIRILDAATTGDTAAPYILRECERCSRQILAPHGDRTG